MEIDDATVEWPLMLVHLRDGDTGASHVRGAVLVVGTRSGFVFVGPGYLDPYGVSPSDHEIEATTIDLHAGAEVTFSGPRWSGTIRRYRGNPTRDEVAAAAGLDWYARECETLSGRTLMAERARLRERVLKHVL